MWFDSSAGSVCGVDQEEVWFHCRHQAVAAVDGVNQLSHTRWIHVLPLRETDSLSEINATAQFKIFPLHLPLHMRQL